MDEITRATRLLETGDYVAAEALLLEILAAQPDSAESLNKLGIARTWQGKFDEALQAFDLCIARHPRFPNAYSNKGNVLKELGRQQEAMALYKQATEADPTYATAYHNLGVLYKEMGEPDRAVPLLKQGSRMGAQGGVQDRLSGDGPSRVGSSQKWHKMLLLGALIGLIISIFAARH